MMFGWNRRDWGNYLGFRGIPGMMETQNSTLAQMMGGGQQQGYDGSATDLSGLLSMMRGQSGGGSTMGNNPYIGGQGLI